MEKLSDQEERNATILEEFIDRNFVVDKEGSKGEECFFFYGRNSHQLHGMLEVRSGQMAEIFKELVTKAEVISLEQLLMSKN